MPSSSHQPGASAVSSVDWRHFADAISDGVVFFDRDWRLTYANPAGRAISRILPEDLNGPTHWELFPTTVGTELERVYRRSMDDRVALDHQFYYQPLELWLACHVYPIPSGIAVHYRNVTPLRLAEAALLQSEKLAAVGRLASSISHEINNPLESITNLLYLIACSDDLSPPVREYVDLAQSEVARVSQIATQTLRFHRQAVRSTLVTADELFAPVLNLFRGRLLNSGIHLEPRLDSAAPVLCLENEVRQVLSNLVTNAIDAMRAGGRLRLRARDARDPLTGRHGLRITVADTGHGMSAATQDRIFEPFFTTKDLNGTGLGLWISSEILQRHQGRLAVRSSQHPRHHGTVFTLFLPADPPPDALPSHMEP